jgi:hypothetical protein
MIRTVLKDTPQCRDVAEQEAYVRRIIVKGTPSQAAEDRLRPLQQQLSLLRERARQQSP